MYSVDGLETKLQTALLNANDVINLKIAKDGKPLVAEKISAGFYVKIGETEAKIGYGSSRNAVSCMRAGNGTKTRV